MQTSDNIDLVIIHPGAAHGIYGELGNELVAIEPPLWPRIIAGYCRDRGVRVRIIDAEAGGFSPDDVAGFVRKMDPRLVCIAVFGHQPSASTQQMVGAVATLRAIKNMGLRVPVLGVGGHISALPQRTIRDDPWDFVCIGEGPQTVMGLLRGDSLYEIPGLVWQGGYQNPRAPLPADLRDYHGFAWDLLPMKLYKAHNWQCFGNIGQRRPYASIYTSLGCAFKCSFCCINAPFGGNRYRMRQPKDVVDEIVALWKLYGVKTFKIVDEMFILNEAHYLEICDRLFLAGNGSINLNELNIWAYARIDTVKPENLGALRRSGFRWLALGIESGSAHVREGAKKRLKTDDIEATVRAIQAADINVIGNYIFGLPDDDMASMEATLALAMSLNTEFANFYSAMAYPGSPLYEEAIAKGWILPETWRGYSQHNDDCRPLDTKHVSGADVLRFRDEAFNRYFTSPDYLAMVEKKFGPETLEHVHQMTRYKLKRNLLEVA